MGSLVHGYILLGEKEKEALAYIHSLGRDKLYPSINSNMFTSSDNDYPDWYDNNVLGFAATYKQIEFDDDWFCFMIKFEHILKNIDFESVLINLDSEFCGSFHFYWQKTLRQNIDRPEEFIYNEVNNWYFGYAYGKQYDAPMKPLNTGNLVPPGNFKYPLEFPKEQVHLFNDFLERIDKDLNIKIYPYQYKVMIIDYYNYILPILTKLIVEKKIEFGCDDHAKWNETFYIIMHDIITPL